MQLHVNFYVMFSIVSSKSLSAMKSAKNEAIFQIVNAVENIEISSLVDR